MQKQDVEKFITNSLKPIFGFTLKRCKSIQDAEDLSQEIILKTFRALICRKEIENPDKFLWTVAHHTLSNYYRDHAKCAIGVSIDEMAETLADTDSLPDNEDLADLLPRLQNEIAYLSKLQRQILIAYYFRNRKQADIAKEFHIPLGTVKWHLFEAKKELKRGIIMTRTYSKLKYDPIKLIRICCNGSPGTKGSNANFFRSALSQNIAYTVKNSYKSVNEIADELGVSPVYVESEADFLEEYGFLLKKGDRYIANILIEEADAEITHLHDQLYEKATALFADELFDMLTSSGLLQDNRILGGKYGKVTLQNDLPQDPNFLLWSLIPYITANSGRYLCKETISFAEAATLRSDGGHNICSATVYDPTAPKPKYDDSMGKFCGCCWNSYEDLTLWQCDSEWSGQRVDENFGKETDKDLMLLSHWLKDEELSNSEYVRLAERGYISVLQEQGDMKVVPLCTMLENSEIKSELLAIGSKIKEKHWKELAKLKETFVNAVLSKTPPHLYPAQMFGLQHIFFSDPWFVLHVIKHLLENKKLKLPMQEQKKALSILILKN